MFQGKGTQKWWTYLIALNWPEKIGDVQKFFPNKNEKLLVQKRLTMRKKKQTRSEPIKWLGEAL